MKKILAFSLLIATHSLYADSYQTIEISAETRNRVKETLKNIKFNYFAKYLGPSLGSGYDKGQTFDRFNSGQNYTGGNNEPRGANEIYQSFRLGYQFKDFSVLSYGVTFQQDLHEAQGKAYDKNKQQIQTNQYRKGYSDNNHRISYWRPLYSNKTFFVSASLYYEIPTTKSSKANNMQFGTGVQPTIGFYTSNPNIMTGMNFSLERDFYRDNEIDVYFDNGAKSDFPTRYQTARFAFSPYFNYALTDKTTLKSSLVFDWDQKGNEAGSMTFNSNMVDIMVLGAGHRFTKNLAADIFVEAALEEMSLNRSAVGASLTLSL